jgi:hypothetical protein
MGTVPSLITNAKAFTARLPKISCYTPDTLDDTVCAAQKASDSSRIERVVDAYGSESRPADFMCKTADTILVTLSIRQITVLPSQRNLKCRFASLYEVPTSKGDGRSNALFLVGIWCVCTD